MSCVIVVGGGIAGLTVAERLTAALPADDVTIEIRESAERLGGKLRTSPFAGRTAVDEGADSFLARVPAGTGLADRVGLRGTLTSPTGASAAVWHHGLHPIPDGLLLGVPGQVTGLARSGLLSPRGKVRAALEPFLPRRDPEDSIGRLIRSRFGNEVHNRLVDALVGSIYATDTDAFSLAMVPQLADLSEEHRSLLLGVRSMQRRGKRQHQQAPLGPLFYAPRDGMEALAVATAAAATAAGATVGVGAPVHAVERDGSSWRVDGEHADAVVLAAPAALAAPLLATAEPPLSRVLGSMEHAGVVIVTLAVAGWPERLGGRSGYLVPKPVQGLVTAASFGSQKWAHWSGGDEIVRVSLGRDGQDVTGLPDDELVGAAVSEVGLHVGLDVQPTSVRISRWPQSFPQYRPGHRRWLSDVVSATPAGLFLTGASYNGIGVPACIADAERTAADIAAYLRG